MHSESQSVMRSLQMQSILQRYTMLYIVIDVQHALQRQIRRQNDSSNPYRVDPMIRIVRINGSESRWLCRPRLSPPRTSQCAQLRRSCLNSMIMYN